MSCRRQRRIAETDEEEAGKVRRHRMVMIKMFPEQPISELFIAKLSTATTPTSTTAMPTPSHSTSNRRRKSTSTASSPKRNCKTIRASLDALDPSTRTQTPSSIRQLVLSHLEELETSLSRFQSPIDMDFFKSSTEDAVEDVRA